MIILQKLYDFNLPNEEMINIYILFIRCMVEYCCVVWHSSITEEERTSIERVQKTALRIILKEDYVDYRSALELTGWTTHTTCPQLRQKVFEKQQNLWHLPTEH